MTRTIDQHRLTSYLEAQPAIDWSHFDGARTKSESLLERVASDRVGLRELLLSVRQDGARLSMCEQDEFRYKLVLYNAEDRDFRLRLHMWRFGFADCAHGHRFSYTARLLRGGYQHTLYDTSQNLYPAGLEQWVEQQLPLDHPFLREHIDVTKIRPVFVTTAEAGEGYTQHHSLLASTIHYAETVLRFV